MGGYPAGLVHNWHDGIGRGGISHNRSSILWYAASNNALMHTNLGFVARNKGMQVQANLELAACLPFMSFDSTQ